MTRATREHLFGGAALLALALAGYGFILVNPDVVGTPHSDLVTFHLALKTALWDSLRAGHGVPFWQTDHLGGSPAFANPQAQYTNPLHGLFWLLPPARAFAPTLFGLLVIAGLATWTLGTQLALPFWPRLLAATSSLFAPKLILAVYAGWLSYLSTIVVMPLLFAAVIFAFSRPGPLAAVFAALAGALCLLGGMAQLVYYALFFLFALVVVLWRSRAPAQRRRALGWLSVGAVLAAGLAAHQLLPALAELPLYARTELSWDVFLSGFASPRLWLTLIHPTALGDPLNPATRGAEIWENSAHFGFAALALALVGVSQVRRRPWVLFFACAGLATLALAVESPVLHLLFAGLPFLNRFRIPARVLFLGIMFVSCLAGMGLERVQALLRPRGHLASWFGAICVGLIAWQGSHDARRYLGRGQVGALAPQAEFAKVLSSESPPYRTVSAGRSTINSGWGASLGLQLVTGYDPFTLRDYQRLLELVQTNQSPPLPPPGRWIDLNRVARWDLLDTLGMRWFVAPDHIRVGRSGLINPERFEQQPVFVFYFGLGTRNLVIYRNAEEQPRARFVNHVVRAPDEEAAIAALRAANALATAVVLGAGLDEQVPAPSPDEWVRLEAWRPGALRLRGQSDRARFLLISEIWHPGWTATVDGRKTSLVRTDEALLGLTMPPGDHTIELTFRPLLWNLSVALTLAAVAGTLALLVWWPLTRSPIPPAVSECHEES